MKPKTKILILLFSLVLPYMALVMYFAVQSKENPLPSWFPYFGMSYILGTILIVSMYSRRIRRNAAPGSLDKPRPAASRMLLAWGSYLVIVWSGLFVWGSYKTIIGEIDWRRSVPAGALLLVFIGIFSGSIYKMRKHAAQQRTSASQQTPASVDDSTAR